ncbi:MAG: DUF1295 domain-containing protein [Bacilli bacterium]
MNAFLFGAVVVSVFFIIFFIIGQLLENNSIVDIGWGLGFVVLSGALLLRSGFEDTRLIVLTALIWLWGLRLAFYLFRRNVGKPEDYRYVNMRKRWGTTLPRVKAFFHVYVLQGVILYIISLSYMFVFNTPTQSMGVLEYSAMGIWLVGYIFQVVGDSQLRAFKQNPSNKGRVMTTGLWKYTRHPNYFGEAVMWWAIFLFTVSSGGWYLFVSPLIITLFLRFVSGVPLLEKRYAGNAEYDAYKRVTPVFVPWFPKEVK